MADQNLAPHAGAVNPSTTAHEDQYAPKPVSGDPVFETRAELESWVSARCQGSNGSHRAILDCIEDIRRVTLAHLHLKD